MKMGEFLDDGRRFAATCVGFWALFLALPVDAQEGIGAPPSDDDLSFEESLFYEEPAVVPAVVAYDPFEGFNRVMTGFNDVAFRYVLTPIGDAYAAVTPRPVRKGVSNFFYNLGTPARMVSAVLQGKPKLAGREFGGFLANSTVGVAGLLRPSEAIFEEPLPPEDLGQTFGYWGIAPGPYLVLPLLGPTTLRDGIGRVGEVFLDPTDYLNDWELELALDSIEIVNELPEISLQFEEMREASVDPYVALRDFYLQLRQKAVEE